jgi:hypothetical protein
VDDQRLSQVRNAELLAEFEAILLELRRRLDSYLELSHNDIIAADEGFNLAGQIQLSELAEHAPRGRGTTTRAPAGAAVAKTGHAERSTTRGAGDRAARGRVGKEPKPRQRPLPRAFCRAAEREADDGTERPQEGEVLAGLEPTRACDTLVNGAPPR